MNIVSRIGRAIVAASVILLVSGPVLAAAIYPIDRARILVSPADRAQQTALALKRKFRTVDQIGPGATVAAVLSAAGWPDSREAVVVVGHQPTLGAIASFLLSGEEAWWSVKKGAVWWLTNRDKTGASSVVLRVVIAPDFV